MPAGFSLSQGKHLQMFYLCFQSGYSKLTPWCLKSKANLLDHNYLLFITSESLCQLISLLPWEKRKKGWTTLHILKTFWRVAFLYLFWNSPFTQRSFSECKTVWKCFQIWLKRGGNICRISNFMDLSVQITDNNSSKSTCYPSIELKAEFPHSKTTQLYLP